MTVKNEPITLDEWQIKAHKIFGDNAHLWKFVCPVCKTVQSFQDFLETLVSRFHCFFISFVEVRQQAEKNS